MIILNVREAQGAGKVKLGSMILYNRLSILDVKKNGKAFNVTQSLKRNLVSCRNGWFQCETRLSLRYLVPESKGAIEDYIHLSKRTE